MVIILISECRNICLCLTALYNLEKYEEKMSTVKSLKYESVEGSFSTEIIRGKYIYQMFYLDKLSAMQLVYTVISLICLVTVSECLSVRRKTLGDVFVLFGLFCVFFPGLFVCCVFLLIDGFFWTSFHVKFAK